MVIFYEMFLPWNWFNPQADFLLKGDFLLKYFSTLLIMTYFKIFWVVFFPLMETMKRQAGGRMEILRTGASLQLCSVTIQRPKHFEFMMWLANSTFLTYIYILFIFSLLKNIQVFPAKSHFHCMIVAIYIMRLGSWWLELPSNWTIEYLKRSLMEFQRASRKKTEWFSMFSADMLAHSWMTHLPVGLDLHFDTPDILHPVFFLSTLNRFLNIRITRTYFLPKTL